MIVYRFEANPTTVSGAWSDNTLSIAGSYLAQIYVRSATASTTFDVHVVDYAGRVIKKFVTATEIVNDLSHVPVTNILTAKILNSSKDEPFEVMLCFMTY